MAIDVFFGGGRKVNALVKGFTVATDQGVQSGGEASAPDPFTLFLSSLAACAGVYVQSFCLQRDIPTEGITLNMDWDYDPAQKMIVKFRIDINVPSSFPEKYDNAVISAASQCAVKRHLKDSITSEVRIIRI
jgi:putative redox protein